MNFAFNVNLLFLSNFKLSIILVILLNAHKLNNCSYTVIVKLYHSIIITYHFSSYYCIHANMNTGIQWIFTECHKSKYDKSKYVMHGEYYKYYLRCFINGY